MKPKYCKKINNVKKNNIFFFQRKSNGKLKNYLHEKAGMLSISADEESWKLSILVHGIANINRH